MRGRRSRTKDNLPVAGGTSSGISAQPEYAVSNSNNRPQGRRRRTKQNPPVTGGTSSEQPPSSGPPLEFKYLGNCTHTCQHCGALFWFEERLKKTPTSSLPRYNRCCRAGRVALRTYQIYPEYIKLLLRDRHFLENIRAYNQMFSMTYLGENIDESINNGRVPYVFKIYGQLYHWIGSLCPADRDPPRFLQLYIYDTDNEVDNRLSYYGGDNSVLRRDIVEGLIDLLDTHNALVQLFRTAREKLQETHVPNFKVRLYNVVAAKEYELPTGDMLGAIVYEPGPESDMNYDIVLEERSGHPQRVNKLHPSYMSLQFPLLFIYGEDGYSIDLKMVGSTNSSSKDKRLTMLAYYSYYLHDRANRYNYLSRTGKLFQQYVVTAFCAIEQNRIDFIREHQNDIRNEYLSGIYDAINRGDNDGSDCGSKLILPQSFTGGPRYMYSHYLDALAICRVHGNPSYFITFTCNVNWPKISEYMAQFPLLTTTDRADIVDRVFEMKINQFINYLRDNEPFGKVVAVLYTVEFQKRGLPHCHTLLWIHESIRVLNVFSMKSIRDPQGHRIVLELMMHGPCGLANPSATCTQNSSRCKKDFPKEYCNQTYVDKSGFVHYKRRDTGITTTRQNVSLDNKYVVPYNKQLLLAFYAHINVEYCGWTMLIKYLFKYISKGTDRVVVHISRNNPTSVSNNATASTSKQLVVIDEIKNYLDARYVSPHEACWRIFEFEIHYREPAVQILAVHLQNMQRVVFRETDQLDSLVLNSHKKKTTLTEWLYYNEKNSDGRHLTYLNFPSEYVWYPNEKYWSRRRIKTKSSIGRLVYVHPAAGDLFYQRMLLCHQTGCTSFPGIRTVNNIVYPTCRSACEALGLLQDDQEWEVTLQEAALTATPAELRALLAHIFAYCEVSDPKKLWERTWNIMSEDIPYVCSISLNLPGLHIDDSDLEDYMLYEFEICLNHCSKSVTDFGLRSPPAHLMSILRNRLLMEEKSYDRQLLATERDKLLPKLNESQRQIFNLIVTACLNNEQQLVFVHGHGGTGKTFLWKTILYTLRCERKIVLAVASSGIASLLLPAGRTAHSRFKIPLDLTDTSVCAIKKNTQLADLLKETCLIVWDESPMNDRRCFKTLDRTLRDILNQPDHLFGGKTVMLGGDFRQTLPVKKGASRNETIRSSIANSYLWSHFKIYYLTENMRLNNQSLSEIDKHRTATFAQWLLDIGNGQIGIPDDSDPDNTSWVDMPDEYCIPNDDDGIPNLINFIYDADTLHHPSAEKLQEKAIVCPKNDTADIINNKILSLLTTTTRTYLSYDDAIPHTHDGGEIELLYPKEYLNSLSFPGLPPHNLTLKVGSPIMLLHNMNIAGGLCNGTRLIVSQLLPKVIEARIITGTRINQKVFLPRILLTVNDPRRPFIFRRKQFPVKVCYAMTINKAQGQSLKKIGIYLAEPVFGHGQLYVALSRAATPDGLKILINSQIDKPPNTTKNITNGKQQIDSAYRITGFSCEQTIPWERTLDNPTSLTFGKFISLQEIPNDDFPKHYFNFAAYNELPAKVNVKNPVLTGLQLSGTSATHYYLNPNIPETYHIKEQYQQLANTVPILNIDNQRHQNQEEEKHRNRFPLATLLEVNPQNYQRARFTSHATIYKISTQNKWYYERCTECRNQVIPGDLIPTCKNHGPQPTPTYSYCFKAIIGDGSGTISLTCFSNQVNSLIKDCNELLAELSDKNPYHLPSALKELEESPTRLEQPEDPMKSQQEKEPADLPPLSTDMSTHIQALQSTPPQIENPTDARKGSKPSNPT
ncbi:DNA helicase [Tanacetum coccineum]